MSIYVYLIAFVTFFQVSFGFSGNSAIIASGVYLNNLDLCSWVQDTSPSFEPSQVFHWHFVEFRSVRIQSHSVCRFTVYVHVDLSIYLVG